jgi:N-carbamoylputrescine amidase
VKINKSIRIALIQMSCTHNAHVNLEKAIAQIRITAKQGAQIICLQELFKTHYFCQKENDKNFALAEAIPGPSTMVFLKLAKELKIVLIIPLFERTRANVFYNTAVIFNVDGKMLGKYRKMHIPYDPGFYEKYYFKPGNLGFPVFQTKFGRIGILICWDQWFPEAARIMALKGAQIIFYPTAIGWMPNKMKQYKEYRSAWHEIQKSHAIANGIYIAAVNRVGQEGAIKFWGNSFVSDPFGRVISKLGDIKEENHIVTCDFSKINQTRKEWPFFRDRRTDAYGFIGRRPKGDVSIHGK